MRDRDALYRQIQELRNPIHDGVTQKKDIQALTNEYELLDIPLAEIEFIRNNTYLCAKSSTHIQVLFLKCSPNTIDSIAKSHIADDYEVKINPKFVDTTVMYNLQKIDNQGPSSILLILGALVLMSKKEDYVWYRAQSLKEKLPVFEFAVEIKKSGFMQYIYVARIGALIQTYYNMI